jgi:DNA-binding MarR family transcriptional regulator
MPPETTSAAAKRPIAPPLAWVNLLRAHGTLTRSMDAALREQHDLSLNEFEVLLHLALEDDQRLRRVDLSDRLLITQGGITRLLAGLERRELVQRGSCESDARVVYAELTVEGRKKFDSARPQHRQDIRRMFSERFSPEELDQLGELLGRLCEEEADESC